jgi:hypothetical protein
MQHLNRPEITVLKGEEAVAVLSKYIEELEKTRPEELSRAQAEAMKKLARGLISAIEEEATLSAPSTRSRVTTRLRRAVSGVFSQLLQEAENPIPCSLQKTISHYPPPNHRPQ